ncbi:MAG: glycosyltransferase family 2 protein [Chitinophagaceae bacterium]|nr:MAG: glycosyltransferase family 2 protein [Chitinophagaceae bacterium]
MSDQQNHIERLRKEISELETSLSWYRDTFENRRVAGIVKDRFFRAKKKFNKAEGLEGRIADYINNNPVTVRSANKLHSVSIIMLSFNRVEDTRKAVKSIYKNTTVPFELIILDNDSNEDVRAELKQFTEKYKDLRVILETTNLGCAKGRVKASRFAKYDHLLFLDNDIIVSPYYVENLFSLLYSQENVAGVCCKVVFPNGKIQFNGGQMIEDDGYALYSLHDEGLEFDEPATNRFNDCQWIPGGATIWKRSVFEKFGIDEEMKGSFEDNEICYRIRAAGYLLLNSPASIVIHDHFDFKNTIFKKNEAKYYAGRNDQGRILDALLHFYNKHHLIFSFAWKNNPWDMIWNLHSREEVLRFIRENNHKL